MIAKTRSTEAAARILLFDDDPAYCGEMSRYLQAYGFAVTTVLNAADFADRLAAEMPDLILLDQLLGDTTGTDVLRDLRARTDTPCIIVTGAPDPMDRVVNLELGADDDVDKSAPSRELLARIRAVLRRSRAAAAPPPPAPPPNPAPRERWTLHPDRRELRGHDGAVCLLTAAEFMTLRMLNERRGRSVSRPELMGAAFGRTWKPEDRAIDTVVRKLRFKIDKLGGDGGIKAVRGNGYVFVGFPMLSAGEEGG
jgi:DNA-binding response OmpR family regulator